MYRHPNGLDGYLNFDNEYQQIMDLGPPHGHNMNPPFMQEEDYGHYGQPVPPMLINSSPGLFVDEVSFFLKFCG